MTDEDRAVLAHVVIDPEDWYAKAIAEKGQAFADHALALKVARWQLSYDAVKDHPVYLPRSARPNQEPADTYKPGG